jgi:hypothetical protein
VSKVKKEGFIVVIPHTPLHDIRTPLYKSFGGNIEDIVVVYDKAILENSDDYEELKQVAMKKLSKLNGKKVALLLTGSYAACVIVYDVLRDNGFDVILLQYDSHLKRYLEVIP